MSITFSGPINNLSLGFCSFNILRNLWQRGETVNWFPIANNADLSSFSSCEPEFLQWLQNSANNALKNYNSNDPTVKLWHINQGHEQIGKNQYLFTFYELDSPTTTEINILNQQKGVFVSSEETKRVFEDAGVKVPVHYIPLGFDDLHFKVLNKKYYPDNITNWLISAKAEKRKHTYKTIQAWLKKFGNNRDHVLTLLITNPFLKPEDSKAIMNQVYGGVKYFNVNELPYLPNLALVNDTYNSADIVLDLSGGEGFSLGAFHTLGLGKHAIIHNCSAMRGWANSENSVLVESNGKELAADGLFFQKDGPFNLGNIYTYDEKDLMVAFDRVLEKKKLNKINESGFKIQKDFQWANTVGKILDVIK